MYECYVVKEISAHIRNYTQSVLFSILLLSSDIINETYSGLEQNSDTALQCSTVLTPWIWSMYVKDIVRSII